MRLPNRTHCTLNPRSVVSVVVARWGKNVDADWATPDLTRVLDMMRDGVLLIDADNVIRYANPPAVERFDSSQTELEGVNLLQLVPGLNETALADHLSSVRSGGDPVELDEWVPGLRGWFRVDLRPADPYVVVVVRDITASRVSERRSDLATAVDRAVQGASSFAEALRSTSTVLQEWLDFEVGEGWMVDLAGRHAHLVFVDHATEDVALAAFADATRALDVNAVVAAARPSPTAGAVRAGGGVVTMPVLADEADFARRDVAAGAGLTAAVHVGLDLGGGRIAVIGLLRRGRLDTDDCVVVLQQLRTHLMAVLSRHVSFLDLEQFFELTREYICVTSLDGTIRRANPALVRVLGREVEQIEGVTIEGFVHPDDYRSTVKGLRSLLDDGVPFERFENRISSAGGEYRWVSWTAHALPDQAVVLSTGRDVTLDRSLQILRDGQNEVMRGLLAGDPIETSVRRLIEVIEEVDPACLGTVVAYDELTASIRVVAAPSVPQSYLDTFDGASVGPAAGSCGTAILERREVIVEDLAADPLWDDHRTAALSAGLAACWSFPILGSDHRVLGALAVYARRPRRPTELHLELLRDTVRLAAVAMQAHLASKVLIEGEERFRRLAEVATDAIVDWDMLTGSRWRSRGLSELLGDVPAPGDSSDQWWIDRVHPEDRGDLIASLERALADRGDQWNAETRFRRADGTFAEISIRANLLRDGSGRVVRLIAGLRDMTERRALERQFLRAQRVESLGTIAGGIAHDLNNSLAPILMAVDLLQTADLDEDVVDVVETIGKSARRSAEMVRKILSYARGIDGRQELLSVVDLVGEAIHLVRDPLPKNIDLEIELADEASVGALQVFGDATQLHQVLVNLLLNARDAMPHGGNLTVGVDQIEVGPTSMLRTATVELTPGRYVRIAVIDTGTGMPSSVVRRLFEPFFTTKPGSEGTGLGLPTSLAIARAHGGDLAVDTEVGRGSTVSLVVPVAPHDEVPASAMSEDPLALSLMDDELRGDGVTVLVVDDERSIRSVLREILEGAGYTVVEASDGREALEHFDRDDPRVDIVLSDIMMPGMDGTALAVRLQSAVRRVPVIAMTGLDDSVRASNLASSGVATVIPKPFDRATVLAALWAARGDAG